MPIENAVTKATKIFDLTSPVKVAEDNGVITGSPTFDRDGCDMDGSNDYITYAIPNTLLGGAPKVSITVRFTPDFLLEDSSGHYIMDATTGARYLMLKNASNNLQIFLGNTSLFNIATATVAAQWKELQENVLTISGESGGTNEVFLNGVSLGTNTTAWTPAGATELVAGSLATGGTYFDGKIHSIQVKNDLTTVQEALDLTNNSTFNFQNKADVWLDMKSQSSDGTNQITKDKSGNGNDLLLGDGTTTTTFPSFLNPGFQTDGGDYMQTTNSGLLDASLSEFTMIAVLDRGNLGQSSKTWVSYEETDLTNNGAIILTSATNIQFYAGGVSGNNAANFVDDNRIGKVVIVGTTTGSETSIWVNGQKGVDATAPAAIDLTANQKLTLFARGNASTGAVLSGGKIYQTALIPFKLTPIQIRQVSQDLLNQYS